MGLGSALKKLKKIADPIGTAAERKTNQVLGLSKKSSSAGKPAASTPTSRGSAGGTGPQTQDMGRPQRATLAGGSSAMEQSRNLTAGARSGVGRLQKAGYNVK